ncbi:60S ribosomal protein L20-B [Dictyocoela muelleri]|nr:60S ribosomal protein L20-B [Dictyocoela muelleri]
MIVKEYKIYGSKIPTPGNPNPTVFITTIFAPNQIIARSKHNKLMKIQKKLKSSKSVILKIEEIKENHEMTVKNYGVKLSFKSKRGKKSIMYKEVRATNRCEAVGSIYSDMAGKHSAKPGMVDIIEINVIAEGDVKRNYIKQFMVDDVEYPIEKCVLNRKNVIFVENVEEVFN